MWANLFLKPSLWSLRVTPDTTAVIRGYADAIPRTMCFNYSTASCNYYNGFHGVLCRSQLIKTLAETRIRKQIAFITECHERIPNQNYPTVIQKTVAMKVLFKKVLLWFTVEFKSFSGGLPFFGRGLIAFFIHFAHWLHGCTIIFNITLFTLHELLSVCTKP